MMNTYKVKITIRGSMTRATCEGFVTVSAEDDHEAEKAAIRTLREGRTWSDVPDSSFVVQSVTRVRS